MLVPMVIEQGAHGERAFDIYSMLLKERIIMLTDEVNNATASLIVAQMLYLSAQDHTRDIMFYINSPGGSVVDGLAIYDTIRMCRCDVNTICMGLAASMGAFLLASGTRGKRFALPHAEIMIHQPSGGSRGQATDMAIVTRQILRIKKQMNEMLSEMTGKPLKVINRDVERDFYMTPQEALSYGLIDRILPEPVRMPRVHSTGGLL
jgi:ATP-dependent Clp protease protease subunit